MTSPDWAQLNPILERALDLDGDERVAYLDGACGDDRALRSEVERLLRDEFADDSFLEPPVEKGADSGWRAEPNANVGLFRLVSRLGAGGMGEVWLAEREGADFRQRVALKLIKRGMDTDTVLRRFRLERKVLAELDHPGIPRLVDGGAAPDGRPYFVMEHVIGTSIDEAARPLSLDDRLRLFLDVCSAVQHAHERGVVHRDLKPSNVIVTADGAPKLLDFGISKVLDASEGFGTLDVTATGQQLLTPRYASPEQVQGRPVSPATDVYALGLLLWELLVGRPAQPLDELTRADIEAAICRRPVPRPSSVLDATGTSERRRVAGDLDTICAMALRKEPERRYATVHQLADDVRRHLAGRRVLARPDTVTYRVSTFVRRNRGVVVGTVATFAALLIGLIVAFTQFLEARSASEASRRAAYVARIEAAEAALRDGDVELARLQLDEAGVAERGWEWQHLRGRLDGSSMRWPLADRSGEWKRFAWDPVTERMSYTDNDLILRPLDPRAAPVLLNASATPVMAVDWAHDLDRIAFSDLQGRVVVVRPDEPGSERVLWAGNEEDRRVGLDVAWSPDERFLASSHGDGVVRVFDVESGEVAGLFRAHGPSTTCGRLRWHPTQPLLVSAGWDETVQLYDVEAMAHAGGWQAHAMGVQGLDLDSTGERLVTCSLDQTVRVWDLARREQLALLRPKLRALMSVRFSPDDEHVVTGDEEGTILVTRWRTEEVVRRLLGHQNAVSDLAFLGDRIASIGPIDGVRLWEPAATDVPGVQGCEFSNSIAVDPSGKRFAVGSPDGLIRVWSVEALEDPRVLELGRSWVSDVAWSPDGRYLASAHETALARWDTEDWSSVELRSEGSVRALAWTPDSTGIVALVLRPPLALVRWSVGASVAEMLWESDISAAGWGDVVLRRDGTPAAAILHGSVAVWSGPEAPTLLDYGHANSLYLAEDERTLYVGGEQVVQVRDYPSGELRETWPAAGKFRPLALHPDGSRLAVGSSVAVELWDPEVGERVAALHGHAGAVRALAWLPDGNTLISVDHVGQVRIWR